MTDEWMDFFFPNDEEGTATCDLCKMELDNNSKFLEEPLKVKHGVHEGRI